MAERKIYAIGETLLDIIFKDGKPQTAKAGGSMLNSVVSLGRISLPVSFISEYGSDDTGRLIDSFLMENGVDTSCTYKFNDGNTALALAFLDNKNDAHYTFYKHYPEKRLATGMPDLKENDILLCGSFYAISGEIRKEFLSLIRYAKEKKAIVIYDPNFRKSHLNDLELVKPMIIENLKLADIIRGSDEDFNNIFGSKSADEAWEAIRSYCGCLVYTANTEGVFVRTASYSGKFPVKRLIPVSTIGAGDNFNAGMIASIYLEKFVWENIAQMKENDWKKVIGPAVQFASHVCMSYDNYIDSAFASRYLSASRLQI